MRKYILEQIKRHELNELPNILVNHCFKLSEHLLRIAPLAPNFKTEKLINKNSIERFRGISKLLSSNLSEVISCDILESEDQVKDAIVLNCWILLGSLTEVLLQMFISIYLDDYRDEKWQQWSDFKTEVVKVEINNAIKKLLDAKIIDKEQKDSLKNAIKRTINYHTKEREIEIITLDELIQLYVHLKLINDDEIVFLRTIQSNRNGVHAFKEREIGNNDDLFDSVYFFCYMIEMINLRLPDIPEEYLYY